jgi:microcystin-dependent protein
MMSDAYVGEIRMFGGNFAPVDWALCDGTTINISGNEVLYSLIGIKYGGDGVTNFKLPDLRGRIPLHKGQGTGLTNRPIASQLGAEIVTLAVNNIPAHTHVVSVGGSATSLTPTGAYLGNVSGYSLYSSAATSCVMNSAAVGMSATNTAQPHSNMMPTLCVNFIISLRGIYPQQS